MYYLVVGLSNILSPIELRNDVAGLMKRAQVLSYVPIIRNSQKFLSVRSYIGSYGTLKIVNMAA